MIGVDEVGRGCLAGPLLVVAARQVATLPLEVTDSKLLNRSQREILCTLLLDVCEFGEGWVTPREIDIMGLSGGLKTGVKRALKSLGASYKEEIILDGKVNYAPRIFRNVKCIVAADKLVPTVSAASIYAKVTRDGYMRGLQKTYPNYGFMNHVGYGTAFHMEALRLHGPLNKVHRLSFKPMDMKQENIV